MFTIEDRRDLEVLRHYNYQELFEDIFDRLEGISDSTRDSSPLAEERHEEEEGDEGRAYATREDDADEDQDGHRERSELRHRIGKTWQSYNLDLGTNNYLADDQFPDGSEPHAVRPWGSWYVGINSVQRTRLGQKVFVEWSLGVSWYSFKFEDDYTRVVKDDAGIQFIADTRDVSYVKSKLSATFINAALVPVLDFSEDGRKPRVWDGNGDGFRFGIGPYVGYRLSSKTKLVYEENGDRQKEKNRDNFYLNNLRYGLRIQIGVRSTDLFINYDMNNLFAKDRGPELNAISFGLVF